MIRRRRAGQSALCLAGGTGPHMGDSINQAGNPVNRSYRPGQLAAKTADTKGVP